MWSAEQRRRALAERLFHLSATVNSAKGAQQELTEGLSELIRRLDRLVPGLITDFDARWQRIDSAAMPAAVAERLKSELCKEIEDLVAEVGPLMLRVVAGGESTAVPVEIETCLQRQVDQAAPRWNWTSILYASPEYNYSVERIPDPQQVLGHTAGTIPRTRRDLVAFSLPRPERDAIGLHAVLLGHEVGHVRDWFLRVTETHRLVIPKGWRSQPDRLGIFLDWGESWISEVVADIFACLTMGPVALLALPELMMKAAELNLDSETHPSPARRIELMVRVLRHRGYGRLPTLKPILDSYADLSRMAWTRAIELPDELPQSTTLYAECGNAVVPEVARTLQLLERRCRQLLPRASLASPSSWPDVLHASDLLTQGIPCGEDVKHLPVDVVTILNAAWFVKVARLQDFGPTLALTDPNASTEDLGTLNAKLDLLALKSIEISEVLRGRV